jgi:endonuclease/exonuclease/phosphatase family metal-dependent hydrolase
MQFNVMNTTTAWQQIAQLAKDNNIDILCCQELQVTGGTHYGLNNIQNNLSSELFGQVNYDRVQEPEGTCIFYRKEKFEVVKQGRYWYNMADVNSAGKTEVVDVVQGQTQPITHRAEYERFAVWAILREKSTRTEFLVTTTHLDYHTAAIASVHYGGLPIQWTQGQTLMNHTNVWAKYDGTDIRRSIIATGDMNCNPNTAPILNMISKGYLDTYDLTTNHSFPDATCPRSTFNNPPAGNAANTTNPNLEYTQDPNRCLDYIFTSGDEECELEVLSHTIHGTKWDHPTEGRKRMSDHNAVSVQLRYTYPHRNQ